MKAIINNPDAKVWDMGKMHGAINTPELKKSLTYMVRGNLEKGIGTMTPDGVVKSYGEVEPEPELAAKYEERYQKFRKIYPACRDLFLELAK
jgi:hypothetical protein